MRRQRPLYHLPRRLSCSGLRPASCLSGEHAFEVELDCDYNLKYNYVVQAITAVSGYREGDQIVKLVEKIKFSPPKQAPPG